MFFGVKFNGSLWLALLVILAAIPSVYGLGFAFASVVITVKEANAFVFLIRGIVMVFCGITYPITHAAGVDANRFAMAAADVCHSCHALSHAFD